MKPSYINVLKQSHMWTAVWPSFVVAQSHFNSHKWSHSFIIMSPLVNFHLNNSLFIFWHEIATFWTMQQQQQQLQRQNVFIKPSIHESHPLGETWRAVECVNWCLGGWMQAGAWRTLGTRHYFTNSTIVWKYYAPPPIDSESRGLWPCTKAFCKNSHVWDLHYIMLQLE